MTTVSTLQAPRCFWDTQNRWRDQLVNRADLAGCLVLVTPILLGGYLLTRNLAMEVQTYLEIGMYGLCLLGLLPCLGPFVASLSRSPANALLVTLFGVLTMSTCAAFARVSWSDGMLQVKSLAATAVWVSIYIVTFASVRSTGSVHRLMKWISVACAAITASVYLSALAHAFGRSFGEILEYSDGGIRAFGPLGDQVGFILVLPALMSLVAARPVVFGVHLGALLLTATRGAVLCLALGVMVYLAAIAAGRVRVNRSRLYWGVAALAVGGMVWLTPISSVLTGRLWEAPDASGYSFRLTAIETGVDMFQDNLAVGLGFNGFGNSRPARYEDWLNPRSAENGLSRTANQYLQTATDGGAPALLLLVLFVIFTGRNAWRVASWRHAAPELVGSQLWLIAVMVGNQGALWLLSNAASGFFVFAVAGIAAKAHTVIQASSVQPRGALLP